MFESNIPCPCGKDKNKVCEGYRKNGSLQNVCAGNCAGYAKFVREFLDKQKSVERVR